MLRSPLRVAVQALSLANILDVRRGDGTYATSLEPGVLLEAQPGIDALVANDLEFHRRIAAYSGNSAPCSLLDWLSAPTTAPGPGAD